MPDQDNGRYCDSCKKVVQDFREKSWKEINQIQQSGEEWICGVYNPKQAKKLERKMNWKFFLHWSYKAIAPALVTLGFIHTTPVPAQNNVTIQKDDTQWKYGTLKGNVTAKSDGSPVPFANITIRKEGKVIRGTASDFDGNFIITPIDQGIYELEISFIGYEAITISKVDFRKTNQITVQVEMEDSSDILGIVLGMMETTIQVNEPGHIDENMTSGKTYRRGEDF